MTTASTKGMAAELLARAEALGESRLALLEELVAINSHADNAAGIARCMELLRPPFERLRFAIEVPVVRNKSGTAERAHFVATRPARKTGAKTALVIGHLDTVFPEDHPFQKNVKKGDIWNGPGTSDMKGGLITALLCLELLAEWGALDELDWRVVFVSDEETSSPTGEVLLERLAPGADYALCFEAARETGDLVSARKGLGVAKVEVRGKTGHAGIAHGEGRNALTALSRFIVGAEELESEHRDLSVSPGGEVNVSPRALNAIPDLASCELEFRFFEPSVGQAVLASLSELAKSVSERTGTTVEVDARIEVPPMAQSEASRALLAQYVEAAAELGMRVGGVETAGVSDINGIASLVGAALDGVGPEGGAFHGSDEFLVVGSIPRRAAMNALALLRLVRGVAPQGARSSRTETRGT